MNKALKNVFNEFKKFIVRGSVIDLAVGIIIGAAFTSVVNSLVADIIMPPIGLLLSGVDFSELYINLSSETYASLAEAKEAGAATINYGSFINNLITFLITAGAVFLLVRSVNKLQSKVKKVEEEPEKEPEVRCTYCYEVVHKKATRCPHCTAELKTN